MKNSKLMAITAVASMMLTGAAIVPSADAAEAKRQTTRVVKTTTTTTRTERSENYSDERALRDQINSNLQALADSLRGLDQGYGIKPVMNRSRTAWTAGSGTWRRDPAVVTTVVTHPGGIVYEAPGVRPSQQIETVLPDGSVLVTPVNHR